MLVMHVLYSQIFSGAENVVCQIIGAFRKYNENVEMIYVSPQGPISEILSQRKIRYVPLRRFSLFELRKIIQQESPDIVHAHDMRASVLAAAACGSIPMISHIHNNNFDSRSVGVKAILYYLAALKAKHIFWVSRSSQKGYRFQRRLDRKSSILHNVVDIQEIERRAIMAEDGYSCDVLFLGRLTYQKNPERILHIAQLVKAVKPAARFGIVGDGELRQNLERENQGGLVNIVGYCNNPYGILRHSAILLLTSRWEGLPMCALEAMALGVPVVSTPVDGLLELIEDGENGYLRETDEEIAETIIGLLSDQELYRHISSRAKEKGAQINDLKGYYEEISTVYQDAVKGRSNA